VADEEEKAGPTEESPAAADDRQDEAPNEAPAAETTGPRTGPEETDGNSRELVGAGAGRSGRLRSAGRRGGSSALSRTEVGDAGAATTAGKDAKDKAARRGSERTRTGPVTFVRESVGELRKVVYPTGQQLMNYFIVVLVFVLFVIAFVSLLDLAFGAAIFEVFS